MAYLALSTANLPDPAIDPAQGASPEDYFNTVLYTGNGSTQSITGVGFQPDWGWFKKRSGAESSGLWDVLRGSNKLVSNSTAAEVSDGSLVSFDSDGFTVSGSSGGATNDNGATYVAWNWKANGSGVTNNVGSITSTVSANTTSGFSIVSYTGTGSAATIGHGLSQAPDLVMTKSRSNNTGDGFIVYHSSLTSASYWLDLSSTASVSGPNSVVWNGTAPTSSVFSVGSASGTNTSGYTYIAYCFHSVEGFSKFGSYVGNGSTDGPFVYTGFRPAFLLVKNTTYADQWWILVDNTRSVSNPVDDTLFPNISNAEQDNDRFNFLSNGFKVINNYENINRSGDTFIYMAFAENPFKYSNAR